MELELEGNESIVVVGDAEITLPDYMTMLSQKDLESVTMAPDKTNLIVAVGRHPTTKEIVTLTALGKLVSLKEQPETWPTGDPYPKDWGWTVAFEDSGVTVSTTWLIQHSEQIDVTYLAREDQAT